MGFRIDASRAIRGMSEARLRVMFAAEKYGQAAAAKLEEAAKQGAPWTDRTGNARQTIAGVCDWAGNALRVGIAGNTDYFPYLEFAHEKRHAVLWPTINAMAPEILRGMSNLI